MEVNHSIVESYWIKDYSSGIRSLTFNTKERWVNYHRYENSFYSFWEGNEPEEHLTIEFPDFPTKESYLCTNLQVKDQITLFFIPFSLCLQGKKLENYMKRLNK